MKRSILVVDDERNSRMGICFTLQQWQIDQIHIDEAKNGQQAWELLKNNEYDLLITDIKMPVMNGLELLEKLREEDNHIICILLTGFAEFNYAQKGIKYGAIDYLLKPVEQEELISAVEKGLKMVDEERENSANIIKSNEINEKIVTNNEYIQQTITYIQENLAQTLSVKEMARKLHLNANYFSVLFKEEVGIPFTDYVTKLRIEQAKALLLTTNMSLEEISEHIGYQTTSYFIRIFKRYEQITPKKYRNEVKDAINGQTTSQ